jgi:hypothetical protein
MPKSFMKVSWFCLLAATLCSATSVPATLPPGTVLPVLISSTLSAKNAKVNEKIDGKLMQQLRLPSGIVIKKGAHISGKVIAVQRPTRLTVQFTQLNDGDITVPLNVSVRALASPQSVFSAHLSVDSTVPDQTDEWTTQQVGGDYVFRGRGYVSSAAGNVGIWNGDGVWGKLQEGDNCPSGDNTNMMQSLWVFSAGACGAFGFKGLTISQDGSAQPMGQITLESNKEVLVRGGSGWLLLANAKH